MAIYLGSEQVGGMSGYADGGTIVTPTLTISTTTGTISEINVRKCGHLIMLQLVCYNTNTILGGSDLFVGTLQSTNCLPIISATGSGYWGARAIIGIIQPDGKIVIRNASSTAMASSASDTVSVTFTYMTAS